MTDTATLAGRDLPVKEGDYVRFKNSETSSKTTCGVILVADKSKANFAVSIDGKRNLRHWELLVEILGAPPATATAVTAPKTTRAPASTSTPAPTDAPVTEEAQPKNYDWTPFEFVQPSLPSGTKVSKSIVGQEITLTKGQRYGVSVPGSAGHTAVNAFDAIGVKTRATIFLVEEGRSGPKRGDDVLYLSLHPALYKPFMEAFPGNSVW